MPGSSHLTGMRHLSRRPSCAWPEKWEPKKTLDSLRHTFATRYLEKGGKLTTLKEILGHKSIETTMIYLRLRLPEIARGIDEIDF